MTACCCGSGVCQVGPTLSEIKEAVKEIINNSNKVYDLNLDIIIKQLVKKGWSLENANNIAFEYRQFLQQFIGLPVDKIKGKPPSQAVDDFWHQHILNVKKYINDCQHLYGFVLNHIPEEV